MIVCMSFFFNLEVGRIIPIDKRESREGGEMAGRRNLWRAGLLFFICLIGNGGWGETGRVLCDRSVYFVLPRLTGLCLGELTDRDNPMSGYCESAVKVLRCWGGEIMSMLGVKCFQGVRGFTRRWIPRSWGE